MAAIAAIVVAIGRSGWRSLRSARSFTGNNLVALIALLMAEEPRDRPSSTAVIYLMVGLLWTWPLSQELTRRIPVNRFRLWPLRTWQKVAIYTSNLLLNPLLIIAVLFGTLSRHRVVGLGLGVAAVTTPLVVLMGQWLAGQSTKWSPLKWIPCPPGALGGLIQNHLRELLQLLDVYLALLLTIGGLIYTRIGVQPSLEASVVIGHIVVLLMSTCAQGNTSFDVLAREQRMRLFPISGMALLLAKDVAWLLLTIPLVVGFHVLPCLAAALVALIAGHRIFLYEAIEQTRWSFATGRLVPLGILQMIGLIMAGSAVVYRGWLAFGVVILIYLGSLWWSGRQWDWEERQRWPEYPGSGG